MFLSSCIKPPATKIQLWRAGFYYVGSWISFADRWSYYCLGVSVCCEIFGKPEMEWRHSEVSFCRADCEQLWYIRIINWRYDWWIWIDLEILKLIAIFCSSHFGGVIIFSICKCVKVVTSGERQLLILYCFYQWELHLLLLVIKESKTKVVFLSCTILGLGGRTIFFSHFLVDREQSENNKGRMYSKIFLNNGVDM